jgi:hypothetical protein
MPTKKSITNNIKTQRQIQKDFDKIMFGYLQTPLLKTQLNWEKRGDFFVKYSLLDESQPSYASISSNFNQI